MLLFPDEVDRGYVRRFGVSSPVCVSRMLIVLIILYFSFSLLIYVLCCCRNGPYSDLMIDEVAHEREAVSVLQGTDPRLF